MNADYSNRNYSLEPVPLILPAIYSCPNCNAPTDPSANSFKDRDGDIFEVSGDDDAIDLQFTDSFDGEVVTIAFYKGDAARIIELIERAAK